MDCSRLNRTRDTDVKGPDVAFYFEDSSNSESELEFSLNPQAYGSKRTPREPSPPLVLAFPLPSPGGPGARGQTPTSDLDSIPDEDQELDSAEEPVEDWMVLGGEDQEGDGDIQLNLCCWRGSSSEGSDVEYLNSDEPSWAVLEKDKGGADRPLHRYYSAPQLTCRSCNQTGHLARVCPRHKRRAACSLCGHQGHRHRGCPRRHCPSCGLPPHGPAPCPQRPLWDQHCLRCGMAGHLADACPDTWRQFHSTVSTEAPLHPETQHTHLNAHCYNCSQSGHYGYECGKRRMTSGTFLSLPYVCHYDGEGGDAGGGRPSAREQRRARELRETLALPLWERRRRGTPPGAGESRRPPDRSRAAQRRGERPAAPPRESRRGKAERQQERRELKKLRRQAEARREGGPHGGRRAGPGAGGRPPPHRRQGPPPHRRQGPPPHPPLKRRRGGQEEEAWGVKGADGARSRKSRESERWKKRRGMRRGYLFPRGDLGAADEDLLSPKNRARQRKR